MLRGLVIALALSASLPAHAADSPRSPQPTIDRVECERIFWAMVQVEEVLEKMGDGCFPNQSWLQCVRWRQSMYARREQLSNLYNRARCFAWTV